MTPTNASTNRGSHHHNPFPIPVSSVNPRTPNHFDTSLFSLDGSGGSHTLSQPYQPTIPAILPTPSGTKRPYSPSLLPAERPALAQGHSPALSVVSPQSSTTTNNYYYNPHLHMQESFSTASNFSPHALRSGGSPVVVDMQDAFGDGFNEHTTPHFEEVEMPPLADDDVYEVDDAVDPYTTATTATTATTTTPPAMTGGAYPPSPRATKSPSPKGTTSANLNIPGAAAGNGSPVVKFEQFTPAHSANGGNGVGVNMRPVSLSYSTSTSSHGGVFGAAAAKSPIVKRGEDGAWIGGIGPIMRCAPGNDGELVFNLKEQSIQAAIEVKNAEIEDWLKKHSNPSGKDGKGSRARAASSGLAVKARKQISKSITDLKAKQDPPKVGPAAAAMTTTLGELCSMSYIREPAVAADAADGDSSDDSSVASSFIEGSLDDVLDDDESMSTSETPPTEEDLKRSELEAEEEQRRLENDPAFFPKPRQFYSHPWNDIAAPITRGAEIAMQSQPQTANAAMMKFQNYADNIETASRVATFGSQTSRRTRRLSSGDVDKTLVEPGIFKRLTFGRDKGESGHQRRSSLWGHMVKKKGLGNGENKNKDEGGENDNEKSGLYNSGLSGRKRGDSTASSIASSIASGTPFGPPKQTKSWSKGTLKVDTSVPSAFAQMAGIGAGIGKSSAHISTSPPAPPEKRNTGLAMGVNAIKALRRPRSRSELGAGSKLYKNSKPAFGIVGLLGQYGGPPALPIKSPVGSGNSSAGGKLKPSFTFGEESRQRGIAGAEQLLIPPDPHRHDGYDDDDDDYIDGNGNGNEAIPVTASGDPAGGTRLPKLNITPNMEGFAAHIMEGTPNLHPKLMERIVYEQLKRYKKLVEYRQKHLAAIKNDGRCVNGAKCRGSVGAIGAGGQEEGLGHRRNVSTGSYEGEGEAYSSDDSPAEGKVAAAQFPPGVPQPPVSRLPAEFECPICFKVKKFTKPSDWTKHVHEDVHPFTCTFPECAEPKSFKRKADWVRHENERHRHLEWWTCNLPDCAHTCFRKDNFVQHLVREHKMAEPKPKAQKAATRAAGRANAVGKRGRSKATASVDGTAQEDFNRVWLIVDDCHKITTKQPAGEKCRFCGNVYPTWKKLTVHLARHMEAISLPVLDLISDDSVMPPNTRSSGNRPPRSGCAPVAPMPKVQLRTDMDIDSDNGMFQRQQSMCEEGALPQNTYTNPGYTHHTQQTPPRSSPHLPPGHQFNMHTPPHLPHYPINVNGGNMGYSPEHSLRDMHPGLHSSLNQSFEYPRQELYPSPASTTPANGGYSPSPTYTHQLQHSPHLHVQQRQQPGYFVYGQASGQAQGKIGVGVGQMHSRVVATAHSLAHGLIENNNGQYPLYAGGTEIPMGMAGIVETGDSAESQYLEMGYMMR